MITNVLRSAVESDKNINTPHYYFSTFSSC